MKTYTEQKQDLLQRINDLSADIAAHDPEANTERLKAEMNEAAANGATDEQLAAMSQAVRLAALGADETGTKHSIAVSRKQAAEKLLTELDAAEAERVKRMQVAHINQITSKLLPEAKEQYAQAFRNAYAAHCRLAALIDRQQRASYALKGAEMMNGIFPVLHFALPIPFGTDGILDPQAYRCEQHDHQHSAVFTEATARVDDELSKVAA